MRIGHIHWMVPSDCVMCVIVDASTAHAADNHYAKQIYRVVIGWVCCRQHNIQQRHMRQLQSSMDAMRSEKPSDTAVYSMNCINIENSHIFQTSHSILHTNAKCTLNLTLILKCMSETSFECDQCDTPGASCYTTIAFVHFVRENISDNLSNWQMWAVVLILYCDLCISAGDFRRIGRSLLVSHTNRQKPVLPAHQSVSNTEEIYEAHS